MAIHDFVSRLEEVLYCTPPRTYQSSTNILNTKSNAKKYSRDGLIAGYVHHTTQLGKISGSQLQLESSHIIINEHASDNPSSCTINLDQNEETKLASHDDCIDNFHKLGNPKHTNKPSIQSSSTKSDTNEFANSHKCCVYIVPLGDAITNAQKKIWERRLKQLNIHYATALTDGPITHIVVDSMLSTDAIVDDLFRSVSTPPILAARCKLVTIDWLIDTIRLKRIANSDMYQWKDRITALTGSELLHSKKFDIGVYPDFVNTGSPNTSIHGAKAKSSASSPQKLDTYVDQSHSELSNATQYKPNVREPKTICTRLSILHRERFSGSKEMAAEQTRHPTLSIPPPMLEMRKKFACVQSGNPELEKQQRMNHTIVACIEECADLLGSSTDKQDVWREFQYKKAASLIRNLSYPITLENISTLKKHKGIGARMVDKIREILERGSFRKLDTLRESQQVHALHSLTKVWGVGAITAQKLLSAGFETVSALQHHLQIVDVSHLAPISLMKTVNIKKHLRFSITQIELAQRLGLTKRALIGMSFYEDLQDRIPREEVAEIEYEIRQAALNLWPNAKAICCGSYRRGKTSSGDVDVLISHDDGALRPLAELIPLLHKHGILAADLQLPHEEMNVSRSLPGTKRNRDGFSAAYTGSQDETNYPISSPYKACDTYMGIGRPIFPPWSIQRLLWLGCDPNKQNKSSNWEQSNTSVCKKQNKICPLNEEKDATCYTQHLHDTATPSSQNTQCPFVGLPRRVICLILRFSAPGIYRRIDLKSYRRQYYAFALLYFTGSDHFNRSMRAYAKRCGLSLSDKGISEVKRFKGKKWWSGESLHCQTEEEIFAALQLPYKSPEQRNCYNADAVQESTTLS